MVIVDTDVLIWVLREHADYRKRLIALAQREQTGIGVTPVQYAEIFAGAKEKERASIETLFDLLKPLPLDAQTGRIAGDLLHRYGKSHGLHPGDALTAAVAMHGGHRLWTLNRKHYPMLEDAWLYRAAR